MLVAVLAFISTRGTPPLLVTPVGFSASEPQVSSSGSNVFVACGAGDHLYVLRSEDGGKSFGIPSKLPTAGNLSLGMRRGPRIAATGKDVVVSAVYGKAGDGRDGDLLSWSSADAGKNWRGPVVVNDVPGSAREGLHAMAASRDGKLACSWLDLRDGGTQIWAATSSDGGASWSKNVRVYRSPDGHVCECCHPSVAFGPKGELYVMFRNWLGGARDMYLAMSTTSGRSFGSAQKLGRGTWPLNACPMDGGAVAVSTDGTVTTAWRREEKVYTAQPGKPEIELGDGTQPWLTIGPNGPAVVWQRQGQIVAWTAAGSVPALGEGRNASVASAPGVALATWADSAGRIWLKRI